MTVSRRVTITYDAPDEAAADRFDHEVEALLFGYLEARLPFRLSDQAFSSEPVIPPAEPLVEP